MAKSTQTLNVGRPIYVYVLPLIVFTILAVMVGTHTPVWFDVPVMGFFGEHRTSGLTVFFKIVTDVGSTSAVIASLGALAVALIPKKKHLELILIAGGVVGAGIIAGVIKVIFGRVRPSYLSHLVVESGKSFPSGHSIVSSALAISIIYLLWKTKWRPLALAVGIAYFVLVGSSRVYLGVHYPSDVLAAWCLSWLWIGLLVHLFTSERVRPALKMLREAERRSA